MNNLKLLRKEKRLTQQEIANVLNISQNTYSYWENGKVKIDNKSLEKLSNFFGVSIDYLLGKANITTGVKIPVLGNVIAGVPISAIEEILDYEEITEKEAATGEFFALRIKGNSMEPRITENDVVIVKQQNSVENGEIAIILVNGQDATCKKIMYHDSGISLISFNPLYPPMFYTSEECEKLPVRIIGKVVELRAKF